MVRVRVRVRVEVRVGVGVEVRVGVGAEVRFRVEGHRVLAVEEGIDLVRRHTDAEHG